MNHEDPIDELLADAANEPTPPEVEQRLQSRIRSIQENPTKHFGDQPHEHSQKEIAMSTVANPVKSKREQSHAQQRELANSRKLTWLVPGVLCLIGFSAILFFAMQSPNNEIAAVPDETKKNEAQKSEAQKADEGAITQLANVDAKQLHRQTLDDGTIVIAQARTKYKVEKRRQISLDSGDLYLIVAKSKEPFIVKTSDGEVRATGTRFAVSASADSKTSAAVAQGTVLLTSKAGEIKLNAGQQGTLAKDKRPTRQAAPRLSHVVSWAKEALEQEKKIVEVVNKENGLIAVDPWGQETRLSLRKYDVDIYIEDGIARTTIDQTFFNHNPWNGEGTFYFPLPPDASVSRLAMYVNGQLNEGGMVTREKGQQIYADALYTNRDPALLEMMEGNMFKMRIFPLEGRQEKRVFLSYTQKLDDLYDTTKYWFPMDHSHSVAGELAIRVRVKDGAKDLSPQSSTHDMKVSTDGDDLVLQYDAKKIKPDQDLLLSLLKKPAVEEADADTKETAEQIHADARIATCEKDGQHYLFARINPELKGTADTRPRQWIVLNDVSASRSKTDLQAQQYILRRLITEADDDDTVFRIDLNTEALNISNEPVSVRSDNAMKLADHSPRVLIGGTNIEAGLAAVEKVIKRHGMENPYLLYLGDGLATDGEKKVSELPFKIPEGVTFVGVGVGKNIDKLFLQEAADRTGGMFANINPDEDIDWRVFDMISALNTPRMVGIDVLLFDENDKPVEAIKYPSSRGLAAGESLTVVARCEEKLPTSIVFRGKINGKTVAFSRDLKGAKENSEYIPRFWAKRHVDQLLKSDMPREEEIVELSQQYYVVTPYTSLIVLENDEMYERYNVERGRKDHWALYDAPKEIEIVREEIDWNLWYGYGNFKGEDGKVKVSSKPKSIQEIVDSIQIRINAPFYFYPPQPQSDSRAGLYHLAAQSVDAKNDPSKLLTLWFLLASGERKPLVDWNRSANANSDDNDQSPPPTSEPQAATAKLAQLRAERTSVYYRQLMPMYPGEEDFKRIRSPLFSSSTRSVPTAKLEAREERDRMQSALFNSLDESFSVADGRRRRAPGVILSASLELPIFGTVSPELGLAFRQAIGQRWTRIDSDIKKYNKQYNYGYWGGQWGDYGGSLDLGDSQQWWGNATGLDELIGNLDGSQQEQGQFQSSLMSALRDSNQSILAPMSNLLDISGESLPMEGFMLADYSLFSSHGGDFAARTTEELVLSDAMINGGVLFRGAIIDERFTNSPAFSGGAIGIGLGGGGMGGGGMAGGGFGPPRTGNLSVAASRVQMPMMMFESTEKQPMSSKPLPPFSLLQLSKSPVKSQPGMTAVLAAEFLSARRTELLEKIESSEVKLDEKEKQTAQAELNAIDAAIANIDKAAVRLEDTGKFWGWNAWNYVPQSHNYAVPQVQAYNGYNWSFDLTRYAGGLYSGTLDMVDEVLNEYGSTKPQGSVDQAARDQINAARNAVETIEIRFSEDGEKLLVASNDRYAASNRNEMYLKEQIVCDGKHLYQIYDSLGLVSKRNATASRLAMLRQYTPHLLEPADSLANQFNVAFDSEDDESFTLKLSAPEPDPAPESAEESKEDDTTSNEKTAEIHLLVKVDRQGRLLHKQIVVDGDVLFTMAFHYTDDQVEIRWIDKADEELLKVEYFARRVDDQENAFDVNTDDRVVFDMPLRKPSFYIEKLRELAKGTQDGKQEGGPVEGQPEPLAQTVVNDGELLAELTYSKQNLAKAVQLKRHQVLSLLQNFEWRRWGQPNPPAIDLLNQVAAMQKQLDTEITRGDVTLYGSAGIRNLVPTLAPFRDVSQMPVAKFFQGRHSGFGDWKKTFDDETGLLAHMAAYHTVSQYSYQKEGAFEEFATTFDQSPLLLALAYNIANQTGKIDTWLELNKRPQWSGFSLLMSVNYLRDETQKKKFTEEFWRWRDELAKDNLEPVLPVNVATVVRDHSEKGRLTELLTGQFEKVKKTESIPALMEFAEYVSSLSETAIANQAYELIREKLALKKDNSDGESKVKSDGTSNLELIKRFAYAQSLWAGRRNREALDQFNLIFAELKSKNIKPSPAFLGATARLAQQAGDAQRAFELEEQALVAEQPYLPEMINLQAFRQRYQWLWGQYTQAIANVPANDKDRETKLDDLIARAEETWIRWYEVDRDNATLPGQMATLLKNAGREKESWKYLSTTIDQKPRDANTYYQLGNWYTTNGAAEKALDWYAQAPQWDTAHPQWIYHYGMALKSTGKPNAANAQFQKIINGTWSPGLQGWKTTAQQQLTTSN